MNYTSRIFQLIVQNRNLSFVDDNSGELFFIAEKNSLILCNSEKRLVFAYLDNSVKSILTFWQLMKSNHAVAMLPPSLSNDLKCKLETYYKPYWIFDQTRSKIDRYHDAEFNNFNFFQIDSPQIQYIHPSIKLLLNTSGTTGSPKFVKLSEENILSNAHSIGEYLPISKNDVTPLNLPIYYSYGLSVLTSNALKGGKIVCTNDDLLKKSFWENFSKFGYSSFAGVPFVYEMLERIGFTERNYPSLKYFTQAGGKLQNHLVEKYAEYALKRNIKFYVMYGQTEATARMSYLDPNLILQKIGSIGKPISKGRFTIDSTNNELCYIGPNVYGGYLEKIADLQSYESIDILCTGDIAYVDNDGFYYLTGRLKRFVKLFGNRINLDEIEKNIANKFKYNIKCVGVSDKYLAIFVTDTNYDKGNITSFLFNEYKIHISVIKIKHIEAFPLTNNGKIDYTKLIALYESE